MTAPDGRTFTFDEWCQYLDSHPDSVWAPYCTIEGAVFDVDGFHFNVHGRCLNAHTVRIAPPGEHFANQHVYADIRTYRTRGRKIDHTPVWAYEIFSCGCDASCWGYMDVEDDEQHTLVKAIRHGIVAIDNKIEWLNNVIASEKAKDLAAQCYTYTGELTCNEGMRELFISELDNQVQLKLF